MTAPLQGAATLIGVEMGRVGCEVSEVSSLTSQRYIVLVLKWARFIISCCNIKGSSLNCNPLKWRILCKRENFVFGGFNIGCPQLLLETGLPAVGKCDWV